MLTPKRMDVKKKILYAVIVGGLVAATGVVLYRSSLPAFLPEEAGSDQGVVGSAAGATSQFDAGELNFLQSPAFLRLRGVGEPVIVGAERSVNPFVPR